MHKTRAGKYQCAVCDRVFMTTRSCKQHQVATGHTESFACEVCSRTFVSESARDQHMRATGHIHEDDNCETSAISIAAPVDTPGEWVRREDFDGRKSFGYFQCSVCSKTWLSAHAFPDYKQGCKMCEVKTLPLFLWKNEEEAGWQRTSEGSDDEDKPHHCNRCEACRLQSCCVGSGACRFR